MRAGNAVSVLFVASEGEPFSKTGGLADVVGALPGALKRMGCDVRVMLPLYRVTRESGFPLVAAAENVPVEVCGTNLPASVYVAEQCGGVPCYFVERDELFDRTYLYGTPKGDYADNALRFTYFCKAVFPVCTALSYSPDIVHCHDWQSALVPAYLKHGLAGSQSFPGTRSVLTIHNLAYQGLFPATAFSLTGLPEAFFSVKGMEFWGKVNFLKAGIVTADVLTTVSPTYCREILTQEQGCGLEGVLAERKKDLYGILNGADYDAWDPSKDPHLPARYGPENLDGKRACKAAVLQELGLDEGSPPEPLFGMTCRLTPQKGVDLVLAAFGEFMDLGVRFILLGEGEEQYVRAFRELSERYRGRFGFRPGFDTALAHRIQAGCDFLLMPSRYEPCGLNHLYAMRYGTIPVARATGGLKDAIQRIDPSTMEGTGLLFDAYEADAMLRAVGVAVGLYRNGAAMERIRKNCMKQSFSWARAAGAYLKLYRRCLRRERSGSFRPGTGRERGSGSSIKPREQGERRRTVR